MQEWAPQAMLFGLAIDLAILGTVHLRLWKDLYKMQLLSLVILLGMGAVSGLIWSDIFSPRAEKLLVVYEALVPAFIFLQLARFMPRPYLQWALLPVSIMVAAVALFNGWGFQSSQLMYYEIVILVAQMALVLAWSAKGTFAEEELLFILGALTLLLVLGPGYGLMWPGLEVNHALFAIIGSAAGGLIVIGRMRSSFLHFIVPTNKDRGNITKAKRGCLPEGILIVPKQRYDEAAKAFDQEIRTGRTGLWISMEPVSHVLGHRRGMPKTAARGLYAAQLTHSTFVENALEPINVGAIERSLSEFLKMTGDGMIFIRDLHYLVSNTDIWEITELLKSIRNKSPNKKMTVVLGTDLIDGWELAHLKKAGAKDWL